MREKILFLVVILVLPGLSSAQDSLYNYYQYISPKPGSYMNLPETNIIIRQGDLIDPSTLKENLIEVVGSRSGLHKGKIVLSDDKKTVLFLTDKPFHLGEKVFFKYFGGIVTINNLPLAPFEYYFHISKGISIEKRNDVLETHSNCSEINLEFNSKNRKKIINNNTKREEDNSLDFPPVRVNISNGPSSGYIFISPFKLSGPPGHMLILDNSGIPIYYQKTDHYRVTDFKLQLNGLISFHTIGGGHRYYLMDSSYSIIDSVYAGNGYLADDHDLQILPNGHFLLMAYDPQIVRMDTIVAGGDSAAIVIGLIVQELDASQNVIFQWRSWDHFKITDATEDIDLTAHTIDYVHGNSVEPDSDGNIIISCRNMDEVTKINRQTGELIWRWGGLKSKNNEFSFINDPVTFSHQHDARKIQNGNITLFDNGRLHQLQVSRSCEYELDEEEKTATLVWSFNNDPQIYSPVMGSTQRLSNENTIVGWGWSISSDIILSEVDANGNVKLEMALPDTFYNYRVGKFKWKTNLFITNPDSIFFESVQVGDSATIIVDLINNSSDPIDITGYYNENEDYIAENPVPFTITPYSTVPLNIKFTPSTEGYFKDYLHIRSDTDSRRVAQVMIIAGRTDTTFSFVREKNIIYSYSLEQNYPNPFNPSTTINYSVPVQSQVKIKIFNSIGESIVELVNRSQSAGTYQVTWGAENISSGIYFYSIEAIPSDGSELFRSVKKMILLK